MYSLVEDEPYERAKREADVDSDETVAEWYQHCREIVVEQYLKDQDERGLIGGTGKIVQIDEAKFGRRKYNRGRP
jgi:hypothetical protein